MKLSLTVEADAINVLALNAGRIAVDIYGIELAALIDWMPLAKCCQASPPSTGNTIITRFSPAGVNNRSRSQHSDWLAAGQHRL